MTQKHLFQHGIFHIVTTARQRQPWCTFPDVPAILIDNLFMTRSRQHAKVFAFCILPAHMHLLIQPGSDGLSRFMHSFKRNSSRDIHENRSGYRTGAAGDDVFESTLINWQHGYYDERIRTATQRTNAITYIEQNAVHHGLVDHIGDWPWTSIHFKDRLDPTDVWFGS